jgi:L-alanine-DL-glutamate epimerase-like enolase superfamily enzyme
MAPIDAALYDIMAKSAGLPVYKFLVGYRDSVPVYVTGGYYREGKGIPELIKEVQGYVDQGINAIKLKVGGISGGFSVEDDYQRVKAVRAAVGPNVKLMLDANQGWDVPTAIQASNRMYDLDIVWLEEPLHWYDDVEPLKQLKLNTRIPLASGEHELTRWGARRLMETGAIDVMQFDCNAHAGITEWRKVADMARCRTSGQRLTTNPYCRPSACVHPEWLHPGVVRQPGPRPVLVRDLRSEAAHRKECPLSR